MNQPDTSPATRLLVNRLKEFVCGATGSEAVIWGDDMLLEEFAALGTVPSAEDTFMSPGEQQKQAWFDVVAVLTEVAPNWHDERGCGAEKAVATIRKLASKQSSATTDIKSLAERCRPAVAHYYRTQERAVMSEALSYQAKQAANGEAQKLWKLLGEIDALIEPPSTRLEPTDNDRLNQLSGPGIRKT